MKKALFLHGPPPLVRLIIFALVSLALLYFDQRTEKLETARSIVSSLLYPVQRLSDLPSVAEGWFSDTLVSHNRLVARNRRLEQENQQMAARLQQLSALKQENRQLRELLSSSRRLHNEFTSARLLAVSMNPFQQKVIVDKGKRSGVERGMPLIDEDGLMGQITRVHPWHSEAMLISDPNHATPIRVLRNGIRSIGAGTGRTDALKLLYLPLNADIAPGDILVTSGLGGRFPSDIPVARVTTVNRPEGAPFANILAEPIAGLEHSREVLLVSADLANTVGSQARLASEETPTQADSKPPCPIPGSDCY